MKEIRLKHAKNFRDLGGVLVQDGTVLPVGKYIRGKPLHGLCPADVDTLVHGIGIKTVIDLRTSLERTQRPNPVVPGVTELHLPVFNEAQAGISREKEATRLGSLAVLPPMADIYALMARECMESLDKTVDTLLSLPQERLPVLFHCTEGKDRTGMVAALLYKRLGVAEEDILADYLFTNRANRLRSALMPIVVFLCTFSVKKARKVAGFYRADASYYEAFFAANA